MVASCLISIIHTLLLVLSLVLSFISVNIIMDDRLYDQRYKLPTYVV